MLMLIIHAWKPIRLSTGTASACDRRQTSLLEVCEKLKVKRATGDLRRR